MSYMRYIDTSPAEKYVVFKTCKLLVHHIFICPSTGEHRTFQIPELHYKNDNKQV